MRGDRKWALNDGQMPNFRGVRVPSVRVEGILSSLYVLVEVSFVNVRA